MLPPFKPKPCRRCGTQFQPVSANHRYCSDACKRGTAMCQACGRQFVIGKKAAGKFCSTECFYEHLVPTGTEHLQPDGYTIIKVPSDALGDRVHRPTQQRWMATHRYVMQQKLGRPLGKHERVHHINGVKHDNRPENLELWKHAHPSGVRQRDYHCPGCRCFEQ